MKEEKSWEQLSFESAFFFFGITFLVNIVVTPLLVRLGISQNLSIFIVNSIGISTTLTYVILVMNNMYRNKKQAILVTFAITIPTVIFSYYIIYLA